MLPDQAGTYALILKLPHTAAITVGRLGRFQFPRGWYVYVGSARGPGGLAARVSRHLRFPKPLHWHVDYLRTAAWPVEVWHAVGSQKRECAWACALVGLCGASVPVPRFGASDCRCPAHLIHFAALPDVRSFARAVGERVSSEFITGNVE
jgi:Uri superfamily endonuclease